MDPHVNIALDIFGLLVITIIFLSCINEHIRNRATTSKSFIALLAFVTAALTFDMISWISEGQVQLSSLTVIANTLSSCLSYIAIICFMLYLRENLTKTKLLDAMIWLFGVLGTVSIIYVVGNVSYEYAFYVDEMGHYVRNENTTTTVLYLLFPVLSFVAIVAAVLFAKGVEKTVKASFIIYTLFPMVGVLLDHFIHGLSVTYIGLVLSILIIYANIYLQKQKMIERQKNALMISQINPHFMYNTLSTIAAMCEISPKKAKQLTVEFSSYLRQNLNTLTSEELVPFEQELKHIECYLNIEKARFGDRLNVIYSIQSLDFAVPVLSIQPLVENAVKHGITKRSRGGTVKILAYATDQSHIVEITDDGIGFDTSKAPNDGRAHIGLNNVKSRLRTACKGKIDVKSTVGVGTRVTVEIPGKKGK